MAQGGRVMRLGRRDLRFVYQPGVYVLAAPPGAGGVLAVGQSDNIARDAKAGGGDFARAAREGVEEAIVIIETDPAARRRLALAVGRALCALDLHR